MDAFIKLQEKYKSAKSLKYVNRYGSKNGIINIRIEHDLPIRILYSMAKFLFKTDSSISMVDYGGLVYSRRLLNL